jgi:hypothetical protein
LESGLVGLFVACNWKFLHSIPETEFFGFWLYGLGMQWIRNVVFLAGIFAGWVDRIRGKTPLYGK